MEERATYSTNTFDAFIKSIDKDLLNERDRGTLFELVTQTYLKNEPMYTQIYDEVWALSEVPEEYNIRKNDTGVDLVAREKLTGDLVAIQCKYYSEDRKIFKKDIDSFLNEVGRKYYSKGIVISSTDNWGINAERALEDRDKSITRIGITQLRDSQIDWNKFKPDRITDTPLQTPKKPRSHQEPAIDAVVNGFSEEDRGKLIMAPGTGKTYTSLIIAEKMAEKKDGQFRVLYLVPSIQLLSQSLRGWTGDTQYRESMNAFAVCSDRKVTKQKSKNKLDDITATDLGFPATTNYKELIKQYEVSKKQKDNKLSVVFSTYQSLEVIQEAQENGFFEFDLIICDEAHRTTGATLQGNEESHFVKVHDNRNIKGIKRLYQTATPRVFGDKAKSKADEMSVKIADMDDESTYGAEFYRLGFGEAVHKNILTDYKVMVLAVDESMVQKEAQKLLSDENNELQFDDVTKIIGCWNGLLKRKNNSDQLFGEPMKRAIAFTDTIANSKMITDMFQTVVEDYVGQENPNPFNVEVEHADGTMNAMEKNEKINWLKSEVPDRTCRILSNARFLTEGVDVPELDAVMFLKPRKSKIDIAQAVGRVMRKAEGKKYGYIILPIGVPSGVDAETVLDNNKKYQVVWDVLNALRSIDERFDATVNKIRLNKKKPEQIMPVSIQDPPKVDEDSGTYQIENIQEQLNMYQFTNEEYSELEKIIYGKIVKKVGNTHYWDVWSKNVAHIAQQHITRITTMLENEPEIKKMFNIFIKSLRMNINNTISVEEAIEMLAQHMITKPVFDSLFEQESFALNNPVSKSMDFMIDKLESYGLNKNQEDLEGFYQSVKLRAEGIDNLKAKQTIIVQLYQEFFKKGFPNITDRLGIVFTPIEVVDFIIHSVQDLLKKHLNKSLSDKNVNILDPFTGTGTFITRLLQSGIINKEKLLYKYTNEIYANEIVLLSYYIAAINIEETYKEVSQTNEYIPYEGIVFTDTFETTENENIIDYDLFNENNKRLQKQNNEPITVIIGNPPYSARQTSDNDNNQNNVYLKLDQKIRDNFAKYADVRNKNTLYDSVFRALMWASERITGNGVIGFIINNSFLESTTATGVRKYLQEKFNYIYIVNLKGSIRGKIGDDSKKEGGNIFDIVTGVTIILLVKDGSEEHEINYLNLGDYKSKDEKLNELNSMRPLSSINFNKLKPDSNFDWINQRINSYDEFYALDGYIFKDRSLGVSTNRDSWVYNFNREKVIENTERMVANFNNEVERLIEVVEPAERLNKLNQDPSYISWSSGLKSKFNKGKLLTVNRDEVIRSYYRPFTKKWLYYDNNVIERQRKFRKKFGNYNEIILVPGKGSRRSFSAVVTNMIPDLNVLDAGAQGFFKYDNSVAINSLFESHENSNINDVFSRKLKLSNDEVFSYIYGILHSEEYREKYKNNLSRTLPRVPILNNANEFVKVGKKLRALHLNFEEYELRDEVIVEYKSKTPSYVVKQIDFATKYNSKGKPVKDKSTIIFNNDILIKNIPLTAYNYIINGRSAIDWIIDQYQVSNNSDTNITENPNEYSENQKYVFNLLKSVIEVSIQTVEIVNEIPIMDVIEE